MPVIRPGTTVIPTTTLDPTDPAAATVTATATPSGTTAVTAPIPSTSAATAAALADRTTTNNVGVAEGTQLLSLSGEALRTELLALAMPADPGTTKPGAFDLVTKPAVLAKVANVLEKEFTACAGQPPDEATGLAWRQVRASCLHLLEEAAVKTKALGGDVTAILKQTVDVIKREPNRALRDFAFEDLIGHAEAKTLPEVKEARALLYPSAPPYEKWPKTIKVVRYCDDDGSKIDDQIWFFKEVLGAKHVKNADGSHTLTVKRPGAKHDLEVTIPPKSEGLNIVAPVGDGKTHVIEYCGHAGHGNFFEQALASGAKGTGEGQVMAAYQCWGEGNTETLERQCPDLQYLSTTEMTSDSYDFVMQKHFFEGLMREASWDDIMKGAVTELKKEFKDDIKKGELHDDTHYLPPTNRGRLLTHYDRDGDGVRDGEDHIFNVVYPRRVDTSGGYDPVVQAVPRFALDGSELSKSVNALSLIFRYDHLLAAADEAKLPWDPTKWLPGGFFEPKPGDLSAFQFTKTANGEVRVALSTLFAQTSREDLQRMLAIETGLWLGKEAGLSEDKRGAMAVVMLQRMIDGQGEWFSKEDGLLDEFWAEEQMLFSRYGLKGFSIADVTASLGMGEHDDFLPKHFDAAAKLLKTKAPDLDKLGGRAPTRVGVALAVPVGGVSLMKNDQYDSAALEAAFKQMGVPGTIEQSSPSWLSSPTAATNMLVTVNDNGKKVLYGVGIDTTGTMLVAARLDLDLSKKINGALQASLARIAQSGGLTVGDAQTAFTNASKTNADPLDAFVAAAKALRATAGVAATFDSSGLYDLQSMGLIDGQKLQTAMTSAAALFPGEYQLQGEIALFKALGAPKAVLTSFNQAVLASNGDEAAWKKATETLRDAIPTSLTLPAGTKPVELFASFDSNLVLGAARQRLANALGLKPLDIAKLTLAQLNSQNADITAATKALEKAFKDTGDITKATIAGLDVMVDTLGLDAGSTFYDALSFDRFGLYAQNDPALDAVRAQVTEHRITRQIEEGIGSIVKASDPNGDDKAARKRFADAIAQGDKLDVAFTKGLGKLDKAKVQDVVSAYTNLSYIFDEKTNRAPLLDAISAAMGMRRADVVLAERLNALTASSANATMLRAFRTAFVDTDKAGASIADALAAGAKALFPFALADNAYVMSYVFSGSFVTPEETKDASDKVKGQTTLLQMRSMLSEAFASYGDTEQKRLLADLDKLFVAAAKDQDPVKAGLAAVKTVARPANAPAPAGELSLWSLSQLDEATRKPLVMELLRLRGYTVDSYAKMLLTEQLDNMVASLPPGTTVTRASLAALVDAAFTPGANAFDAALKALKDIVAVTKQQPWTSLDSLFATGVVPVPTDWQTKLQAALTI